MENSGEVRLAQVERALQDLGGEATWPEILNQVTVNRNGDYSNYLNFENYEKTAFQIIQKHCIGYRKYRGPTRFEKVGTKRFRLVIKPASADSDLVELTDADAFEEGSIKFQLHRRKERNRRAVERKKEFVLMRHGALVCEVCDFDFAIVYGPLGSGFAECHHTIPLASLEEGHRTRLSELAIVCANCHRILHKNTPMLSIEELRKIVLQRRKAR